ncbi:TRAP transporter small permease subunit [Pyruvatibacter mobilis]|uniref:TRAP transporter small permease subunit n=1 Tax=Pyruvatibacter mobilis TaxID=1712261 RepID=UPI003BAE4077
MTRLTGFIDGLNERLGRVVSWLALLMVVVQFIVVIQRYVFGIGSIWMQESIVYMHGMLFMLAAGYTLLHNGHVRVDVFYREATPRRKALTDLFGSLFFLLPMCAAIIWLAWPYVSSSWSILEGSKETSGIHGVYLLKSVIIAFAVLVALQGVSLALHSLQILSGQETPSDETPPDIV